MMNVSRTTLLKPLMRFGHSGSSILAALTMIALGLVLGTTTRAQDYTYTQISLGNGDADWPAIAITGDDDVTQVAWTEYGHVWTQIIDTYAVAVGPPPKDALFPPYDHGLGTRPRLCWSGEGFVLAFQRGSDVVVYRGDPFFDDTETVLATDLVDDWEFTLDLWGNPPIGGTGSVAHLVIGGDVDWTDYRILHARLGADGAWSPLETIASDLSENPHPQASYHDGPAGPEPRIYFSDFDGIYRTDWDPVGQVWQPVVDIGRPGQTLGGPLAAEHVLDHEASLSSYLQPPCPCNVMTAAGYDAGSDAWWGADDLTRISGCAYDWPLSPNLHLQDDGTVHVFFMQVNSDESMEPVTYDLVYRTRSDGVWTDRSALLSAAPTSLGDNVALGVTGRGQPLFAFADGSGSSSHLLWLARPDWESAVPQNMPAARAVLTASPNPFNPAVTLTVHGDIAAPHLAGVFDLRGRRVAQVPLQQNGNGGWAGRWDGRDPGGSDVPSGAYLVRVATTDVGALSQKITLAR